MDKQKSTALMNKVELVILYSIIFLLPLAFSGMFPNKFIPVKLFIVSWGLGALLITKAAKNILRGQFSLSSSIFDFPVLLLLSAYIVSGYRNTPNKMEAFFQPGTATIVALGVLLFFIINQLNKKDKNHIKLIVFASAVVVSLVTLLATTGVFKAIPQLPAFMKMAGFNTVGGGLEVIIFLLVALPGAIALFIKEKEIVIRAFVGTVLALLVFALVVALFNAQPGKQTSLRLADFRTSWVVAVETLKNKPLLGIGPGNYLTAFNLFRPISYNNSELWRVRFTSGRSFILTSFTETGLIGLASLILIFYLFIVNIGKNNKTLEDLTNKASLGLMLLAMIFFPMGATVILLFFVYLAAGSKTEEMGISTLYSKNESKLPFVILYSPIILIVLSFYFYSFKVIKAEYVYQKALDAVVANDGRTAYDTLQRAINTNPYVDRYRISYAQINLALANAIASNPDITDQDRATIAQLVQQAIREGKVAISLNPQRSSNWEMLARIYQSVAPLAQNSNQFAVQTLQQAIALDPINPDLRITQGGIFYAAGDYQNAASIFELAVAAKPDLANSHFNLAFAYQELGKMDSAIQQMSIVLSLVERGSNDYNVAQKALSDMQEKAKAQIPAEETGNLTPPQQEAESVLNPQLELSEDAAPPQPDLPTQAGESSESESTQSPASSPSPTPLP